MKYADIPTVLLMLIGMSCLVVGCSHNHRNEYTSPDLFEPVYLTGSGEVESQPLYADMYLYESLDRHFNGKPEQEYHTAVIQYASLTPTDQFLASEGFPSDALTAQYTDAYQPAGTVVSGTFIENNVSNPYIYEWSEWQSVQYPQYVPPQTIVSYHIYTNYNPYDPYWFDPYWSYSRLRSYHYPFHPAYRYGGSLAYGYWNYPYYYYPYYYYPYYPRKHRETYTAQDVRERRTGVRRNPSPRTMPLGGYNSYSSMLRSQSSRTVSMPSTDRIFSSPHRDASNSLRRNTLIPTGRPNSVPRIQVQSNQRSQPRSPNIERSRVPVSQPSRNAQPSRSLRQSSGSTTSNRR